MNDGTHLLFQILRLPCAHCAVVLLFVLGAGVLLTTFNQSWVGALPNHGHLLFGVEHGRGGAARHIHRGDGFDAAQTALRSVTPLSAAGHPGDAAAAASGGGRQTLSFAAAAGTQPDITTFSFAGALGQGDVPPPAPVGALLRAAASRHPDGAAPVPPAPPPRPHNA